MAPRVAGDVSELAAGEVEAAIVATNIASHSWVSLPLLTSGIHVFVEKLMATSLAEARAMVETATANSVCLAVGHMCRFLFVNRWVQALIDSGVMGEITGFDVREGTNYHLPTGGRLAAVRAAAGTGPYSPTFWDAKSAGCCWTSDRTRSIYSSGGSAKSSLSATATTRWVASNAKRSLKSSCGTAPWAPWN